MRLLAIQSKNELQIVRQSKYIQCLTLSISHTKCIHVRYHHHRFMIDCNMRGKNLYTRRPFICLSQHEIGSRTRILWRQPIVIQKNLAYTNVYVKHNFWTLSLSQIARQHTKKAPISQLYIICGLTNELVCPFMAYKLVLEQQEMTEWAAVSFVFSRTRCA